MTLWQNFQEETVSRLALREPVTASPEEALREVIIRMRAQALGCAIVTDEENKPIGILTESRLTQLLSEEGPAILDGNLEQHMTTPCPRVELSDPISEVVEAMQLKKVRFLCVIDESGRVVGLTGQKGVIEFVAEHFPSQIMVQRIGQIPSDREGA